MCLEEEMEYIDTLIREIRLKNPHEPEFLQAVQEVLTSIKPIIETHPEWIKNGVMPRLVEPERILIFRVPWVDDQGNVQVNRGFRVQFNSAIGPYKGGLRFHPAVNLSVIKFLAFEQTLKNALTGLPLGGAKGGSDFDPKGKSEGEIMRFCQNFMTELYRHLGSNADVPAGDLGVGAREIGFLYGMYKKITNQVTGVLTGKGLPYGGILGRKEATGYGLSYFMEIYLNDYGYSFSGKRVIISGSGNVALYAAEKVAELGGIVVAMSDSTGVICDEQGIDLKILKQIKEVARGRIKAYPRGVYYDDPQDLWRIKADIALPCATQNELDLEAAKVLVENGCIAVGEGANMPTTPEAIQYFYTNGVLFAPGKATNAGGVIVSGFEMSQNSGFIPWSFQEVEHKLKAMMENLYLRIKEVSIKHFGEVHLVKGANVLGILKVAEAMLQQGVV